MTRQSAFTYLFWGFLFVLLNFYIQHINVLPDTLGYILIAIGINRLREDSDRLQLAFWLSLPLIVLSLPNIHQTASQASGFNVTTGSNAVIIFGGILTWCLGLILVFQLCTGIEELAMRLQQEALARRSRTVWTLYLFMQIGVALVMLLAWTHAQTLAVMLGIVMFIYSLLVLVAFLSWLWACRRDLTGF